MSKRASKTTFTYRVTAVNSVTFIPANAPLYAGSPPVQVGTSDIAEGWYTSVDVRGPGGEKVDSLRFDTEEQARACKGFEYEIS